MKKTKKKTAKKKTENTYGDRPSRVDEKTIQIFYYSNPRDCKKGNEHLAIGYEKIVNGVVVEKTGKQTAYAIIRKDE